MASKVAWIGAMLVVMGCGKDEGGMVTPPPSTTLGSSEALIDEAERKGLLTHEEALVYRVFATFGDQRLPTAYRGAYSVGGTSLMVEVQNTLGTLSAATRETLQPFLLPPSAPGSWMELPSAADAPGARASGGGGGGGVGSITSALTVQWTRVTAQGGMVTIWSEDRFPGEAALAQAVAAEIDARIWDKLFGGELNMKKPAPDNDAQHHGPDGSLDIYLVHRTDRGAYGVTTASARMAGAGVCGQPLTGAHVLINTRRATGPRLMATVAHELMHASQFNYPGQGSCDSYAWWSEATATWVEDFVYPGANTEHDWLERFFVYLYNPLDLLVDTVDTGYSKYVFPFFVQRRYGKPSFVRRSWELSTFPKSREAVQVALTEVAGMGGFKDAWPEFAKLSFNKDAVLDYKSWDGILRGAVEEENDAIPIDSRLEGSPVKTKVTSLSAKYTRYKLTERVRQLGFDSLLAAPMVRGAHVWLIPKIDGAWKEPEKLGAQKKYCRDRAGENISEFVLVVSNSEWQERSYTLPDEGIRLTADFAGCTGFAGTATLHVDVDTGAGPATLDYNLSAGFEPDMELGEGGFKLTSLSWTFHALYDLRDQRKPCRTEQNAAGILSGGAMGMGDSGYILVQPGANGPMYIWGITLFNDTMVTQVSNCGSGVDETTMIPLSPAAIGSEELRLFEMDGAAAGTRTVAGPGQSKVTTWKFVPQR